MKHLSKGVEQIANSAESINIKCIHFGSLIGQQSQVNGGGEHMKQQWEAISVSNGGYQSKMAVKNQLKSRMITILFNKFTGNFRIRDNLHA